MNAKTTAFEQLPVLDATAMEEALEPDTGAELFDSLGLDAKVAAYSRATTSRPAIYRDVINTLTESAEMSTADAARALVVWGERVDDRLRQKAERKGVAVEPTEDMWTDIITRQLPHMLGQEAYDELGETLGRGAQRRTKLGEILEANPGIMAAHVHPSVAELMVQDFSIAGLARTARRSEQRGSELAVVLTAAGKQHGEGLGFAALQNAHSAHRIINRGPRPKDTRSIEEIYADDEEKSRVKTIEVSVNRPSVRVYTTSELLLGHKDSKAGHKILREQLQAMATCDPADRPDVIVLSSLMQGVFRTRNKRLRESQVAGLGTDMGRQFREAKELLDLAKATGAKVVYNTGKEDRDVADEYNLEVMGRLVKEARRAGTDTAAGELALNGMAGGGFSYYQADKLRQQEVWNEHLDFQRDVVFPYCLRLGRRLYSAEEMADMTEGAVQVDEYKMLFEIKEALDNGDAIDEAYVPWVDQKNLSLTNPNPDGNGNVIITDDFNLVAHTTEGDHTIWGRDNLNFSSITKNRNHMDAAVDLIGHLKSQDEPTPTLLLTFNGAELVGVDTGESQSIVNAGTMMRPEDMLQRRANTTDISGDYSRRQVAPRRRLTRPVGSTHELTDDGRHLITIWSPELMEKSASLESRHAIHLIQDLQIGSDTARPDLAVSAFDYVGQRVLPEEPVVRVYAGDIMHGDIYPFHKYENGYIGLVGAGPQKEFILALFDAIDSGLSDEDMDNILREEYTAGNHEWNNGGLKWHGDPFIDAYKLGSDVRFLKRGLDPRAKIFTRAVSDKGEPLSSFSITGELGDYRYLSQHFALAKGAKGGTNMPIYQSHEHLKGTGDLLAGTDIELYGHWHHAQFATFGGKLAVVGSALAGLSEFEHMRGYRARIGSTLLHLGGNRPPQLEFLTEESLLRHVIANGVFSDESLRQEGYTDDPGFNPRKHTPFMNRRAPKSARQKRILDMVDDAAQGADNTAILYGRS